VRLVQLKGGFKAANNVVSQDTTDKPALKTQLIYAIKSIHIL
jgi:hypothetical protein